MLQNSYSPYPEIILVTTVIHESFCAKSLRTMVAAQVTNLNKGLHTLKVTSLHNKT